VAAVAAFAAAAPATHAAGHRYGTRTVVVDGTYTDGQFYDRATRRRFVPRGTRTSAAGSETSAAAT